jgi:RNA 2',3'-cyclic 3'-phosphodiesterase
MRLFVGIELPDVVKAAAALAAGQIRDRVEGRSARSSVRWVPAENLHITLWFLGEVRDEQFEPLVTALRPPIRTSPFDLRLGGAGAFPDSGPPRALWLGVLEGAEPLRDIHRELAIRLAPLGFEPERRPYSPHLTIARVQDLRRSAGPAVRAAMTSVSEEIGCCSVASVTLFRSRPTASGSRYECLLRVPLE